MQGVVLRRTKQTKIDGEPVVKLPERRQQMEQRAFSPPELEFYNKLRVDAADSMKARGLGWFCCFGRFCIRICAWSPRQHASHCRWAGLTALGEH